MDDSQVLTVDGPVADARQRSLVQLRDQARDLATWLNSLPAAPDDRWRSLVARAAAMASDLAASASGYVRLDPNDVAYARVGNDLARHGWLPLTAPDLAQHPAPRPEVPLGHRRGWARGSDVLILWFTAPDRISLGYHTAIGTLPTYRELRAAITSSPDRPLDRSAVPTGVTWCPFWPMGAEKTIATTLAAHGWRPEIDAQLCTADGAPSETGSYVAAVWAPTRTTSSSRIHIWRVGQDVRAADWAGAIPDLVTLVEIAAHR